MDKDTSGFPSPKERARNILLWATAILLLVGCLLALYLSGFFRATGSGEAMREFIQAQAPWSHLVYFLLQLISIILAPIPSNIIALAGAVLFGTWPAFLLTWSAVALGSVIMFFLARGLGQKFVARLVSRKLSDKYLHLIRRKRDIFLFLAFLFPFFPDDILCILSGLTDISWKRFVVLVLVARPWGLLFACGLGGSVLDVPLWGLILLGAAGVAVFVLAMIYGDRIEQWLLGQIGRLKDRRSR